MIEVKVQRGVIHVSGLETRERAEYKGLLTYQDSSRIFRKEKGGRTHYNPNNVRNVRFYSQNRNTVLCRAGFLPEVVEWLEARGLDYDFETDYHSPLWFHGDWTKAELRRYFDPSFPYVNHQIRALMMMLRAFRGVIKVPTSGGKTEIMSAYLRATGLSAVVVADSTQLIEQTAERLKAHGLDAGIWHGSRKDEAKIICSTMQSLKSLPGGGRDCFICDEAHIASNKTIQGHLADTHYRFCFGFSATPDMRGELEFAKIRQFFGPIIAEVYVDELIENEVVTPPCIRFIQTRCVRTDSWESAYNYGIVDNYERNLTIIKLARESKNALILFRRKRHGQLLQELMPEAEVLDGDNPLEERQRVVERFLSGELRVIIASNIFKQGISINNIDTLINASGGKSGIETVQKVGRAMRKAEGKERARIFDFTDHGNKWTRRHARERWEIYKQAGYNDIEEQE